MSKPTQLSLDVANARLPLDRPLLTADQAAGLLAVKPSWIHDAARRGELPSVRVGKHLRFHLRDLEACSQRTTSAPSRPRGTSSPPSRGTTRMRDTAPTR